MAKRWPIKLPSWHEKRLIWWAAMKGTSKTGLAQNILQARVEANADQIEQMLMDKAEETGVPLPELKRKLLDESSYTHKNSEDEDDE